MRVGMYYSNNDVRIEQMPVPEIGNNELLIKVQASGICGTDVMEWYRIDRVPLVLGHEIAGELAGAGRGVKDFKKGMRVSASHHVPCGECRYCLDGHETICDLLRQTKFYPGGFAEFVRVPSINIEKGGVYCLPDNLSFEEATFIEPLACVLRGQRKVGIKKGKTVLVIGSGLSGLLHIQLAKITGAALIVATDIIDFRLNAAKKFGADAAISAKDYSPDKLRKLNDGRLADVVILCTGAKLANLQALESVERGGTILFFAATEKDLTIPLSINNIFWRNEITLTSSYAGSPQEHIEALNLITSGKINVKDMITHRLPLEKIQEGFRLVAEARDSIKVIIEP